MEDIDRYMAQALLYKIQLEQERIKRYQAIIESSQIKMQIAQQDLKLWEQDFKAKLSETRNIQTMSVDADTGIVSINTAIHEAGKSVGE